MRAVNLLPTDLRSADRKVKVASAVPVEGSPLGAYLVLGGLAAVVAASAATVLASNGIHAQQRELASVQAQQVVVQREADRLAPFGSFRQVSEQRTDTVRQLADSRFDWERALRDLSRAIPSDVTLDTITGTVTAGTTSSGGGSSNPLRSAIAAPAIELAGCTSSQTAVANLMGRMRAIQGVTRVSLASSQKEAPTANASGAAAAGTTSSTDSKPKGCGKGSPPKFQIVLFFEGANAAAGSLTPTGPAASATPGPGATPTPTPTPTSTPATGAAATPTPTTTPAAPSGSTSEVSAK